MNSLFALCVLLMAWAASASAGGIKDFHCSADGNATITIDCALDCQQQHGSDYGVCGDVFSGDHNCYCNGRSGRVSQRSPRQCIEMNDSYRNLCTFDCICNHGADGGHCMWDMGVCYCENWGRNPNNVGCPVTGREEWLGIAKELITPK